MMTDVLPLIVGPYGALVVLSVAAWLLWRDHRRSDAKRDQMLDRQMDINEGFADALPTLTATVNDAVNEMLDRGRRPAPARRPTSRGRSRRTDT